MMGMRRFFHVPQIRGAAGGSEIAVVGTNYLIALFFNDGQRPAQTAIGKPCCYTSFQFSQPNSGGSCG